MPRHTHAYRVFFIIITSSSSLRLTMPRLARPPCPPRACLISLPYPPHDACLVTVTITVTMIVIITITTLPFTPFLSRLTRVLRVKKDARIMVLVRGGRAPFMKYDCSSEHLHYITPHARVKCLLHLFFIFYFVPLTMPRHARVSRPVSSVSRVSLLKVQMS